MISYAVPVRESGRRSSCKKKAIWERPSQADRRRIAAIAARLGGRLPSKPHD
jgi:hypothetical protein